MKLNRLLIWAAILILCVLAVEFLFFDLIRPDFRVLIAGIIIGGAIALVIGLRRGKL